MLKQSIDQMSDRPSALAATSLTRPLTTGVVTDVERPITTSPTGAVVDIQELTFLRPCSQVMRQLDMPVSFKHLLLTGWMVDWLVELVEVLCPS